MRFRFDPKLNWQHTVSHEPNIFSWRNNLSISKHNLATMYLLSSLTILIAIALQDEFSHLLFLNQRIGRNAAFCTVFLRNALGYPNDGWDGRNDWKEEYHGAIIGSSDRIELKVNRAVEFLRK